MQKKISTIRILSEEFFRELNNPDSSLCELLDRYTFLFILQELEPRVRYEFLSILDQNENTETAIKFARSQIQMFDIRLKKHLKIKITPFLELKDD